METSCLQQTPKRWAGGCLISRSHRDKLPPADPEGLGWGVPAQQEQWRQAASSRLWTAGLGGACSAGAMETCCL